MEIFDGFVVFDFQCCFSGREINPRTYRESWELVPQGIAESRTRQAWSWEDMQIFICGLSDVSVSLDADLVSRWVLGLGVGIP